MTRACEFDWNAFGEQLSPAQQNAETAEFESLAGDHPGGTSLRRRAADFCAENTGWTNIHGHSGFLAISERGRTASCCRMAPDAAQPRRRPNS